MAFAEDEALMIHHAIHAGAKTVDLGNGEVLPITKSKNGCLSVTARGYNFMEQNVSKSSSWATRARNGDKITWIPSGGAWACMVNDKIEKYNMAIARGVKRGIKQETGTLRNLNSPGGMSMQPGTQATTNVSAPHALLKQESLPENDDRQHPAEAPLERRASSRKATARGAQAVLLEKKIKAEPMPTVTDTSSSTSLRQQGAMTRKRSRSGAHEVAATVPYDEPSTTNDVPTIPPTAAMETERPAITGTMLVTQVAVAQAPLVDINQYQYPQQQQPAAPTVEIEPPPRKKILSDEERQKIIEAAGSLFIEIDYNEISMHDVLGEGAMGTVHLALWKGTQVAVKVLKNQHVTLRVRKQFLQEMVLMSQLQHPNIVQFLGASTDPMALTTAFYKNGSLHNYLHARHPRVHLSFEQQLRFSVELCRGLKYLHSQSVPIIHRDLKPANVLLDDDLHIRLADFGLSRSISESVTMTGCIGTPHYMAPEIIHENRYTVKADIYSVGIMFYEIATGEIPYRGFNTIQIALKVIGGLRPAIPDYVPISYRDLMQSCWDPEPENRPTCEEVENRLLGIAAEHKLYSIV